MKIRYLESVDSTQKYLKNLLKSNAITLPYAVVAREQTAGQGSRDNSWIGLKGNLFLSFAIQEMPKDLKPESASIYYAYILKETLEKEGSTVWLKWPNDFYINDVKIGGMITNIVDGIMVCGVGLNLITNPKNFEKLDISISVEELVQKYLTNVQKQFSWKQVFSKYKLEFYKSQDFFTHTNNETISLVDTSLNDDGSITSNKMRIYSIR